MMDTIRYNMEEMRYERPVKKAKNRKEATEAAREGRAYIRQGGVTALFNPFHRITLEEAMKKGRWMQVFITE